jgi:hypothetical protein
MAQEKHCWQIRQNPNIRRIFEEGVFASSEGGPEECCVSLDGCAALFRPAVSRLDMHVDQVPDSPGASWGSVQGAYNLYEVRADAAAGKANAGFVCVVGSHRLYDSMWEARRKDKSFQWPKKHWHKLEEDSPLQHDASLITSPANSLVLWRSDLLHKNYGGDFSAAELGTAEHPRLPRLTQFVAFSPKKYRTEAVLQRKALAVVDGCCNNHWAALSLRVPITPFPAWSAAAKQIPVIRPSFSPDDHDDVSSSEAKKEEKEENKEEKDDSSSSGHDRDEEEEPAPRSNKKQKRCKKNDAVFESLPQYVQDLL